MAVVVTSRLNLGNRLSVTWWHCWVSLSFFFIHSLRQERLSAKCIFWNVLSSTLGRQEVVVFFFWTKTSLMQRTNIYHLMNNSGLNPPTHYCCKLIAGGFWGDMKWNLRLCLLYLFIPLALWMYFHKRVKPISNSNFLKKATRYRESRQFIISSECWPMLLKEPE